jgi:hypothetical protein
VKCGKRFKGQKEIFQGQKKKNGKSEYKRGNKKVLKIGNSSIEVKTCVYLKGPVRDVT